MLPAPATVPVYKLTVDGERLRDPLLALRVGDEVFHLQLRDGRFLARSGPSPTDPTLTVRCDLQAFMELALHQVTPSQALKEQRVTILHGRRTSLTEVFRLLAYTPSAPAFSQTS